MHLLVLAEDFYPNTSGGAHARWRFCQLAVERGHEVTVFTPRRDDAPKQETTDGVTIYRPYRATPRGMPAYTMAARTLRLLTSFVMLGFVLWWLQSHDIDGVHSASAATHWVGKVTSKYRKVPLVTFVGYTPSVGASFRLTPTFLFERFNFRYCMGDTVFCRTPRIRELIEDRSGKDVHLLHGVLNDVRFHEITPVNKGRVRNGLGIDGDDVMLAFVGRLAQEKRPDRALDLLASLPEQYSLVIVGDGPEEEAVMDAIERQELADRVRVAGRTSHGEALRIIASSDALVLSSDFEAYPTVVFEALSLGTTVIAPPVGILTEIDHPRLHLSAHEEMANDILDFELKTEGKLDESTLARYSIRRYSDTVIGAFERSGT